MQVSESNFYLLTRVIITHSQFVRTESETISDQPQSVQPDWEASILKMSLQPWVEKSRRGSDVFVHVEGRKDNHQKKCEELREKPGFWAQEGVQTASCCEWLWTNQHITGSLKWNHVLLNQQSELIKYHLIIPIIILFLFHLCSCHKTNQDHWWTAGIWS